MSCVLLGSWFVMRFCVLIGMLIIVVLSDVNVVCVGG